MTWSFSFLPPYAGEDKNIWMTRDSNLGERATQADALAMTSWPLGLASIICLLRQLVLRRSCVSPTLLMKKSIVRDRTHDLSIWGDHSNHQAAEMTAAAIWDDEENFSGRQKRCSIIVEWFCFKTRPSAADINFRQVKNNSILVSAEENCLAQDRDPVALDTD